MRIGNNNVFNPFTTPWNTDAAPARGNALANLAAALPALLRGRIDGAENLGVTRQALTAGATETRLPHDQDMPAYDQGKTNGCGTTSLAMIMSYLGVPMTQADVDNAIRRMDVFTAPTDLLDFARDHGLAAEGYNHGSWEEMKSFVDRGIPAQALIDVSGDGDPSKLHYVAVKGFGKNADGSEYVILNDPAQGMEVTMSRADFEKKWGNTPMGFDHYFNVYAPAGTPLPASRFDGIEGTLAAAKALTNFTNDLGRIIHANDVGDVVHGAFGLIAGTPFGLGAAITGAIGMGANWLHDAVKDIPVVREIVQPFASLVGGVANGAAQIFGGFGKAADQFGGAFGSLFRGDFGGFFGGIGKGIGSAVTGVVDGVGTALKGVGNAVVDVAKGVGNAVSGAAKAVGKFFSSIF